MKVVVVYLDDEGYEALREEYTLDEAFALGLGKIIEKMRKDGVAVRQVGNRVIELFEK